MPTLKLGVAGLVHDHVWGLLSQFKALSEVELAAAADSNPPLLERMREMYGLVNVYRDYRKMLDREDLDLLLVCTENSRHADVVELAAEKGVHVMMEKPMSANLKQADRIVAAAGRYGVKVMVNYPTTWHPGVQYMFKLVKNDVLGRVFHLRFRGAHAGPKEIGCSPYFYRWLYDRRLNGAGAFMDYCCYGVNLALWFMGRKPSNVLAYTGRLARMYLDVDDNAVLLMDYLDALAVAEASWSQIGEHPIHGPIVNGVEGSAVLCEDGKIRLYLPERKGDYRKVACRTVSPPDPPEGWRSGPEYFVKAVLEDRPLDPPVDCLFNRGVQEVLEAGLKSAGSGKRVHLGV